MAPGDEFATGLFSRSDQVFSADLSDLPKAPFTAFGALRLRTSLLADVAIRARTGGKRSLDDALRAIVAESGNVSERWPMSRVAAAFDAVTGVPVFTELYAAHRLRGEAMDLAEVWQRLGVLPDGLSVRFDERAPLVWIRRALVAPEPGGSDQSR